MSDQRVNDLPALSVRRPYLAAVMNLLIIIAGISAILGVEVRELPDVDRPIVSVRANYPGASPETLDSEVTSVIEGAVARVNGVKSVRSSSEEDNLRIHIEFSPAVNLIDAANDVREAVSRVQRDLPEDVENIVVIKADQDARPVMRLSVSSAKLAIEDLTQVIEKDIIPELTAVTGVADVQLFGERKRVLRVLVDPNRLATYGLSVKDVADLLRSARQDVPAGSFEAQEQEILVRANASVTEPQKIKNLRLKDGVRLGDLAEVYYGPADAVSYVRLDGRTVIDLGIVRQAQSNTVSISEEVTHVVAQLNKRLRDVTIKITTDDAIFIKGAIQEVLFSLAIALIIVVAVIWLFSGQFRVTIIPAVAIPVALIGSVAAIWLFGFSINLITLLALVLATGMVVDDAIVVIENILRRRSEGIQPRAAAVLGTRQVFFAVIATTATLISVFLPISFMPSTAGRLFREFGFVLAVTVAISSFVALTLAPMIASRLPASRSEGGERRGLLGGIGNILYAAYAKMLDAVLAAPLIVLSLCCALAGLAYVLFQTLGEELVPPEDRGVITVRLTGPDGVDLGYTDRQVERVEKILKPWVDNGTIESVYSITGRWDFNRGWIDARLKPWSEREITQQEITAALDKPVQNIPGAQGRIVRSNSLGLRDADGGIKFALTGSDYQRIAAATDDFVRAIEREIPQLRNLRVEFRATQPQISLEINRLRASDLGVSIDDLATTLRVLVDNFKVAELSVHDQLVPIIVQSAAGAIDDPSDLGNLYVTSARGRLVPLIQLVSFKEEAVAAELDRHGQRRAIEVDADMPPEFTLRQAVDALRKLAERELPPGIGILFLGEAATLEETSHELTITFIVALIVVFLVLVAQFESMTSAAVVMTTVPFGICAAVFAMTLTGTTLNIYSQIGILLLVGIMAKNGILMVEFADQLRDQGADVRTAARKASLVRLKPIMMTMVSTVLAGLPLILGTGPGSEARAAIGWVVFGGLGLAAVFTLFLNPLFYTLLAPLSKPRAAASERLAEELSRSKTQGQAQQ